MCCSSTAGEDAGARWRARAIRVCTGASRCSVATRAHHELFRRLYRSDRLHRGLCALRPARRSTTTGASRAGTCGRSNASLIDVPHRRIRFSRQACRARARALRRVSREIREEAAVLFGPEQLDADSEGVLVARPRRIKPGYCLLNPGLELTHHAAAATNGARSRMRRSYSPASAHRAAEPSPSNEGPCMSANVRGDSAASCRIVAPMVGCRLE